MEKNQQKQTTNTNRLYREKVKVLLVEIVNRNLGDAVIAENAAYLVKRAFPLFTRRHYVLQRYGMDSRDFEMVKAADLIIFDGGGIIKYKYEHFYQSVFEILQYAKEYQIPVFFNSVGVEGYDGTDDRCLQLKQALNYDCVKGITVRDDYETLQNDYLDAGRAAAVDTAAVIDSAVYTQEAYQIQKSDPSHTIGIGIVRSRIFEDNELPQVTKECQLQLWAGIVHELEEHGYAWKLFVNGLHSDYEFAKEVLEFMGRQQEQETLLVNRPAESRELVQTIAGFEGIIACRMHANIIAYALGIPSIGIVWNRKLLFWGERIGYPQRFFTHDQFEPKQIVQCLLQSLSEGVRPCEKSWKKSVKKPLNRFVRRYGTQAWKKKRGNTVTQRSPWADRLVACALGGLSMRYLNMNSPNGLHAAFQNGFRNFEADIRLTTDGRLVCVNGWSKASYEKLGVDPLQYDSNGMAYAEFLQCGLYSDHYETMDAEQLLDTMSSQPGNWKLILDIGKPKKEVLAVMIEQLAQLCGSMDSVQAAADASGTDQTKLQNTAGNTMDNRAAAIKDAAYWRKHLMIRLQSRYDVETVQQASLPMEVMFFVAPEQQREEKGITLASIAKFCKKRQIKWVSMPKEAFAEDVIKFLKEQKLKSCLFSYNTYTEAVHALETGVDWVATSYLSVRELEGWYERC